MTNVSDAPGCAIIRMILEVIYNHNIFLIKAIKGWALARHYPQILD